MAAYLPYLEGIQLGATMDVTKPEFACDIASPAVQEDLIWKENPEVQTRCCIVENIKSVCDLLDIRPELALKVKVGQVQNPPIEEIVKNLYDENVTTVAFRVDICLCSSAMKENSAEETSPKTDEKPASSTVNDPKHNSAKCSTELEGKGKGETVPRMCDEPFDEDNTIPKVFSDSTQPIDGECHVKSYQVENGKEETIPKRLGVFTQPYDGNDDVNSDEDETIPKAVFDLTQPTAGDDHDLNQSSRVLSDVEETVPKLFVDTPSSGTESDDERRTPEPENQRPPPFQGELHDKDDKQPTRKTLFESQAPKECNEFNSSRYRRAKVKEKHWGNELLVVLKLASKDKCAIEDTLDKNLLSYMLSTDMLVDDNKFKALRDIWARAVDNKISDRSSTDVKMSISYFSFVPVYHETAKVTGMMHAIHEFRLKFQELATHCQQPTPLFAFSATSMSKSSAGHLYLTDKGSPLLQPHSDGEDSEYKFYQLGVSFEDSNLIDLTEDAYILPEKLFRTLQTWNEALKMIQNINDARVAVTREQDDYGIEDRLHSLHGGVKKVEDYIQAMGLHHNSYEDAQGICDQDFAKQSIKISGGDDLDLVLLGKTGHGKSSLGNSILLKPVFTLSHDPASETWDNLLQHSDIDGRRISVVDTPGLYDTHFELFKMRETAIVFLSKMIAMKPNGYHALVFVFRYSERMTEEVKEAIRLLKRVLGDDVIRSHGVFVITAGDVFEKRQIDFHAWCHDTSSHRLDELFEECSYRCVLFDNETKDENVKKCQLLRLVSMVDKIGSTYTNDLFQKAKSARDQILAEGLAPERREAVEYFLNLVVNQVQSGSELDNETWKRLQDFEIESREMSDDDQNCIVNLIYSIRQADEVNKKTRLQNETKIEITTYLDVVSAHVKAGNEIHRDILQKLETFVERARVLTADDFDTVRDATESIKETNEQNKMSRVDKDNKTLEYERQELEDTIRQGQEASDDSFWRSVFKKVLKDLKESYEKRWADRMKKKQRQEAGKNAEQALKTDRHEKYSKYEREVHKEAEKSGGCFHACNIVQEKYGGKKKIEDISVGDFILARDENGFFYDIVYMFGHRDEDAFGEFVKIETVGKEIYLTGNHLVCCLRNEVDTFIPADCVKQGDMLVSPVTAELVTAVPVLRVSKERKQGLFAPFTKSGTLVVDGFLMSCYIDALEHKTAHKALWPMRKLYDLSPSALAFINGKASSVPLWARLCYKFIAFFQSSKRKNLFKVLQSNPCETDERHG